jgi:hypothetical protein
MRLLNVRKLFGERYAVRHAIVCEKGVLYAVGDRLAAKTDAATALRLLAIPGTTRGKGHIVFDPSAFDAIAAVLKPNRRQRAAKRSDKQLAVLSAGRVARLHSLNPTEQATMAKKTNNGGTGYDGVPDMYLTPTQKPAPGVTTPRPGGTADKAWTDSTPPKKPLTPS